MDGDAPKGPGTSDGPKRRDRLARVLDALQAAAGADKGVRSPLYNWMKKNHDQLSAAFAETPPSWSALSGTFGKIGLTDRDGKVPTPKAARQTWYRVRLDVAAGRKRREDSARPALGPREVAAGVESLTRSAEPPSPSPVLGSSDRPRPKIDFRPAVARDLVPAPGGQSEQSTPATEQGVMPAEQVDEKLRAVLDGLGGSSRTRMPKRVE